MDETPDAVLAELFALREEREPDCDPGDLTIVVQDDMPMAEVSQRGQTIGRGGDILSALVDARENVREGRAHGMAGWEPLWTFEQAWEQSQRQSEAFRAYFGEGRGPGRSPRPGPPSITRSEEGEARGPYQPDA